MTLKVCQDPLKFGVLGGGAAPPPRTPNLAPMHGILRQTGNSIKTIPQLKIVDIFIHMETS